MGSLKDQLLSAGLTDKQSVKNARKQKKQQPKVAKKLRGELSDSAKQAEKARLEKAQRDKELNRQRQLESEKKAIDAQIKQLVESSKIDREGGEVTYSFTFGKKVKSIYVTVEQQKQLARGQVSIVVLANGQFELVPKVVAEKIGQRDSSYLVHNESKSDDTSDEDDPYADYEIPDDLVW